MRVQFLMFIFNDFLSVCVFETGSHVTQVGLEATEVGPQPMMSLNSQSSWLHSRGAEIIVYWVPGMGPSVLCMLGKQWLYQLSHISSSFNVFVVEFDKEEEEEKEENLTWMCGSWL